MTQDTCMNLLTFDLEDWRPLADRWVGDSITRSSGRIPLQMDRIRTLLDRGGVRATFFCLGAVAEEYPQLIRALHQDGHEIASHGYSHLPLNKLTPAEFEQDLMRGQEVLAGITGLPPKGFRAPQFSIMETTWWAFDILAKQGFTYDSSVFPIRHRRYGVPRFGRTAHEIETPHGCVVELPLATLPCLVTNLPVAGGGYARLLPQWLLDLALESARRERVIYVTYFHPYEFDPQRLILSSRRVNPGRALRRWWFCFHQNLGRASVPTKVDDMLRRERFCRCIDFVNRIPATASR